MNAEYQYLIGKLQDALATDPRVNVMDLKIIICGGRLHLTGEIPTEERRAAVEQVIAEIVPDIEISNELTVYELNQKAQSEMIHA
ncbi:MAG TPA: BON domain-containing protein [Blastocatellia bacterium]|nr:BON domain-containing protein [Blastocatellia bacterium]